MLKTILHQVWALYREKKFLHLIIAGFAGAMAFVYFEEFVFSFEGKAIDSNISHAIVMVKIFLVLAILLRGVTFAMERRPKADELNITVRDDSLRVSHIFLIAALIASLLSWSLHENTTTVFHFVSISLILSYALFHFISSIKHMNFMAKPSLFELEEGRE
jgi:hypothetical protein